MVVAVDCGDSGGGGLGVGRQRGGDGYNDGGEWVVSRWCWLRWDSSRRRGGGKNASEGEESLIIVKTSRRRCSRVRELHYLLDKVVSVGTAPGPNSSDHNVNTITNGDGMPRMRTFRETIFPE
ncbi:hypothetical protein Tco_0013613 [Tanacetum coccineum]